MTEAEKQAGLVQSGFPVGDAIDFLRLIWAIDHALQRRSKLMIQRLGISGPQRLAIRIIGRFPSIYHKQVADILHVHPSSLTALLKRLERRGLISRRSDGRDRRRSLLGLTARGRTLNREMPGTVEAAAQRTLRASTKRDLDGARAVLSRFAEELDRSDGFSPADALESAVAGAAQHRA